MTKAFFGLVPGTKYKTWQFEITWCNPHSQVINVSLSWMRRCSHAGFYCYFGFLHFSFDVEIIDCRHWDYKEEKWKED